MKKLIQENKMSVEKDNSRGGLQEEVWSSQDREFFKSKYSCEVLKHNCTLEEAKDTQVPVDAYIVTYFSNGKLCYDLTRSSKRVNIFDMYYDTMGKNVIRSIDWGCGKINPKLWGNKVSTEKKKRR